MHTWRTFLAVVALALVSRSAPAELMSAGGLDGAWFVRPGEAGKVVVEHVRSGGGTDGSTGSGSAGKEGWTAGIRAAPAAWLDRTPEAVAGDGSSLTVVFGPVVVAGPGTGADGADATVRQVRRLERRLLPNGAADFSTLRVLAPMMGPGRVVELAQARSGVLAIRRGEGDDAAGSERWLEFLHGGQWKRVDWPAGFAASEGAQLVELDEVGTGRIMLAERSGRSWMLDDANETAWKPGPALALWSGRLVGVGGQVLEVSREQSGAAKIALVRGGESVVRATFADVAAQSAAFDLGGLLVLAWREREDGPLQCRAVTPAGVVVYEGEVEPAGPVTREELQTLGVMIASLFLTVLVFVLRPVKSRAAMALPLGFAPAEPMRRAGAMAFDLVPGLMAAEVVFNSGAGPGGVWPLLVVAAVTMVLGTVGEAVWGKTVGKAIMGCRTIEANGKKPGWGRAILRNAVKVACPALGLLVVMGSGRLAHPGAFGTAVVVGDGAPPEEKVPGSGE